jgi:hypothetical protein
VQLLDQFDSEGNADTVITSDGKNSAAADKVDRDGGKGGFRSKDEEMLFRLTAYASCLISGAR